jgi:hypothetical protein
VRRRNRCPAVLHRSGLGISPWQLLILFPSSLHPITRLAIEETIRSVLDQDYPNLEYYRCGWRLGRWQHRDH